MKKQLLKIITIAVSACVLLSLTACSKLDIIGNGSQASFEEVLNIIPVQYSETEKTWFITAPDGAAEFHWSRTSGTKKALSSWVAHYYDAFIEFDPAPFIAAGLDTNKLPDTILFLDNKLIVGTELELSESDNKDEELTAIDSFRNIVKSNRERIGHHSAMDHFGIKLDNGNMFEWARDISTNDKDIVFVINPEPFIAAGTDPDKIEGWVYSKVEMMDENGNKIEEPKILKPFNLK
ncbi:hypothetical protein AGMMS50284_3420 [Clostridia bacterium]|nr:hypothetical protein AGMMS50284_3420 [Clostridia bacterium]